MPRNPSTKLFDEVEDLEREEEQDLLDDEEDDDYEDDYEDEDDDDYFEEDDEDEVSTSSVGGDFLSEFDESSDQTNKDYNMKTYIFYAIFMVLLFVADILTLRSGLLGSFERGLAVTALFVFPTLFMYAIARVFKLREEQDWVAKFDEA